MFLFIFYASDMTQKYRGILGLLIFLILITICKTQQLSTMRSDFDTISSRLIGNRYLTISAQNDYSFFRVAFAPYGPENTCFYSYRSTQDFVLSIAIGQNQTYFVYIRTNDNDTTTFEIGVSYINKTKCLQTRGNTEEFPVTPVTFPSYVVDNIVLKVDPAGEYAYVFLRENIFIYDIHNGTLINIPWSNVLPNETRFFPKDADITVTKDGMSLCLLANYYPVSTSSRVPIVYLLHLEPPSKITVLDQLILINDSFASFSFTYGYFYEYIMSISIEHQTQQILVALPFFRRTFLLKFNATNLILIDSISSQARSVGWIDNGTQAILLINSIPTLPWASSQLHIIDTTTMNVQSAIPNNQQSIPVQSGQKITSFNRLIVIQGEPIIFTADGLVLYVPASPIDHYIEVTQITESISQIKPCPSGTWKNRIGPYLCTVCPTGFKKMLSNNSVSECQPCLPTSYCPLASVNDVNQSYYPSINQGYPYPNSPPSDNYDDIIIQNTFQISSSSGHCLVVSPLFWTLLVFGIIGVILCIMGILYWIPNGRKHFTWLKKLFQRTDIVGEGELWFGGLASFALIVLIIFGFWFGSVYIKQYPIEKVDGTFFTCDSSLKNAKFSSTLHLLALLKAPEEKTIFQLLDQQNWTLVVDFVQTGFTCQDILVQGNIESYQIILPVAKCFLQSDNATLTLVIPLTTHLIDVQFNLTGNSYVGASRICVLGPSMNHSASYSSIQQLSFCEMISNDDQTISQHTSVQLDFTKVINRTESLYDNDPVVFSGIWIPTVTIKSFNDRIAYEQQGDYIRYLSSRQILSIDFSETQFYIRNIQEPIAKSGEIIFHNILFSTVCIELFGLAYLLFKLVLFPAVHWIFIKIMNRYSSKTSSKTIF
ncbi:unnamed protein product [Adineta ricciae]|uniref:Transmembrane protein n=1 Tax=Adineta ricciae TaxID=249248 RepID=A0A814V2J3_ADIRI|nr:unnamed protein product [Adineta ricciae]